MTVINADKEVLAFLLAWGCVGAHTPWPSLHTTLILLGYRPADILPSPEPKSSPIYIPRLHAPGVTDVRVR